MSATTSTSRPPVALNPVQWLKKNLFSTWYNSLLTLLALFVIYVVVKGVITWVFFVADWTPVTHSLKLFAVGLYPIEEIWRLGIVLAMVSFLMGMSWGVWGGTVRTFAIALGVGFLVIAFLPFDIYPQNSDPLDLLLRLGFVALPALIVAGFLLGRTQFITSLWVTILWLISFVLTIFLLGGLKEGQLLTFARYLVYLNLLLDACAVFLFLLKRLRGKGSTVKGIWLLVGWLFPAILGIFVLLGFDSGTILPLAESSLWGGLLLTFLLALVGIIASFPIGVALALGRQSTLPVLKVFCTLFIEMVRGVPLVTILFMASIILPLFLPEDFRIDRVLRAMIGMTLFAAAYMAENVRGGLQAIPRGQYEAAKAVGLTGFQTTTFIILPQALRAVIPAIVGQFIALFMDTTLAIIVGLMELLAVGKAVLQSNQEWLLRDKEVYLFIAVLFWIFTYSMSYASRRLEVALGLGER